MFLTLELFCHIVRTFGFTNLLPKIYFAVFLITPKSQFSSSTRWPNYGRFYLSGELLIRIHYVLAKQHRHYSKMAADYLIFFCTHLNWPLWPRFRVKILLNFLHDNEVIRANLYAYKRMLSRRPLTNNVYMSLVSLQKTPFMKKGL